jgi:hypothetical protein
VIRSLVAILNNPTVVYTAYPTEWLYCLRSAAGWKLICHKKYTKRLRNTDSFLEFVYGSMRMFFSTAR